MIHQDHTFEVGSLCHQEQDIWATGESPMLPLVANQYWS